MSLDPSCPIPTSEMVRIVALEREVKHLKLRLDDQKGKIDSVRAILLGARQASSQ